MKKIIILVIAILIAFGAWIAVRDNGANVEDGINGEDLGPITQTAITGEVVAIDLSQAMVDGPYVVLIADEEGSEYTVAIPSMGLPLCAASSAILDVSQLEVGDMIEVNGTLAADGTIVPCESPDHYLKAVAN